MENTIVVAIVAVLATLLVVGIGWFVYRRVRRERLERDFGPEYEREVERTGDRGEAENRLEARRERVEGYDLRPLEADERRRFSRRWDEVQKRFVDEPASAVSEAQTLVEEVMEARGYPLGDIQTRQEDVSVESPGVVHHFREARGIARASESGDATTEDLRKAMKHYRELFNELLEGGKDSRKEAKTS